MNWASAIPIVAGILTGGGVVLKGMSWLAKAWTDKAVAEALKAKAAGDLANEVREMRISIANYLARTGEVESRLLKLETRGEVVGELSAAHGIVQR